MRRDVKFGLDPRETTLCTVQISTIVPFLDSTINLEPLQAVCAVRKEGECHSPCGIQPNRSLQEEREELANINSRFYPFHTPPMLELARPPYVRIVQKLNQLVTLSLDWPTPSLTLGVTTNLLDSTGSMVLKRCSNYCVAQWRKHQQASKQASN